jgi:hypothetical protein
VPVPDDRGCDSVSDRVRIDPDPDPGAMNGDDLLNRVNSDRIRLHMIRTSRASQFNHKDHEEPTKRPQDAVI